MARSNHQTTLARPIAAEDLRPGLYVALLHDVVEVYRSGCDEPHWPRLEHLRLLFLPDERPPLKIIDICLPFVFVEEPDGQMRTLDARQHHFAQLDRDYARRVFRKLAPRRQGKARRKR